jgi:membrane-associated phospholipid phosphatase
MLWRSYASQRELFGGGISAMPSMHVAMSVLMACGGWQLGRKPGWLLTIFAVLIWIGSVHLGWHYALDGVVALGLTLAIWKFSGWLVARFVMRETPAAAWQPALAE